ncbi:putative amino acid transporter [Aspergillus steynii IBT 23096]|uniref:Putative amino acid transporter n=1 Tax=Aspergillus steynii IBT 23096 TaxID=1392250 RepID=A0A2I2FWJ3_9EURO|nr:putative amino acid transporter [Aspergillus steynii IBT 23096]PLB44936.1 putative amino acid transporter [Aspergillus steynii IBT 23096]
MENHTPPVGSLLPGGHEPDPREADILAHHLDPQFTASLHDQYQSPSENGNDNGESSSTAAAPEPQSSLTLQGGDVHRDLYRIEAKSKQAKLDKRAYSFSYPHREPEDAIEEGVAALEPGSFRRHFIQHHRHADFDHPRVTTSFVDFLDLYGNFAGEDLVDTEEDDESVASEDRRPRHPEEGPRHVSERTALLGSRKRSRVGQPGDASDMKAFLTLLKAFVGTGIIFLPRAFRNGGILFSSITLVTVAIISTACFNLLLQCRRQYGGGYGDIGERISGPQLRSLILSSIAISQVGFVCACIIFTAENLHAFLQAVTANPDFLISAGYLIVLQLVILIPLGWIRNISKLGPIALIADAFILLGLAYIYCYDLAALMSRGMEPTVKLFNPSSFTLTIGSSIFTFEGIGLILPIQSSMKQPEHFNRLLYLIMTIITILFTAVGALSYATFGESTQTEIFSNFPQTDPFVNTIQFLYALAILVGTPIQMFPAARIIEGKLFGPKSGKHDKSIKWKKNVFRTVLVICCGVISAAGAGDLDKFVSLIGSFACVPLVYIYPAYLHWKGVAESPWAKRGDMVMVALGVVFMIYTTSATVSVWIQG